MPDDPEEAVPARVPVTTAWLAEQEAKQAAYAARRRAWAEPGERPPPLPEELTESVPTTAPPLSATARRPRGPVHDPRQQRLEF